MFPQGSFFDRLQKAHPGSWFGLSDLGYTEAAQKVIAPTKSLTEQRGSNLLGGNTPTKAQVTNTIDNTQPQYTNFKPIDTGTVLGTETTKNDNGGGGGGGSDYDRVKQEMLDGKRPWDDNLLASLHQNAQSSYDKTLEAIQGRLNEARRLSGQKIAQATQDRDYLMDLISKRYPELIGRAEKTAESSLSELDKNATDLESIYARANAQARRRSESAALKNRMIARANNRLGSSFYDDLVSSNQESLGRQLGESDLEKIGKIAAIQTRKSDVNTKLGDTVKDLEFEKTNAENEAVRAYKEAVSTAEALDRAGVLDFGEAEAQARDALNSRLERIDQYAAQIKLNAQNLAGKYDTTSNFLDTFQTFTPELTDTLNENTGFENLSAFNPSLMNTRPTEVNSPVNLLLALSRNKRPTLDEIARLSAIA